MTHRRTWWLLFGVGVMVVLCALLWVSALVLRLEQAELQARAQAQHQEQFRLALWRMDSWLGPRIAREAARPYFEYLPFYAQQRAYTRILHAIEPGEVITPSPLLAFESDLFPLHFQIDSNRQLTSPQTPTGNWRDLAEAAYLPIGSIDRKQYLLDELGQVLGPVQMEACVAQAEAAYSELLEEAHQQASTRSSWQAQTAAPINIEGSGLGLQQLHTQAEQRQSRDDRAGQKADLAQRAQVANYPAQTMEMMGKVAVSESSIADSVIEVGALVPFWIQRSAKERSGSSDGENDHQLLFARRVRIDKQVMYQGFVVDWVKLRSALSEQIADLFPAAQLQPMTHTSDSQRENGGVLASVPVGLRAECPAAPCSAFTSARVTLGLTWLAVIGSVFAAGLALRASIAYGERRSRFASAVTHELRTPLTTFRMYSEMLAEDMVQDQQQRKSYLNTLKAESGRLATLVENVLSYARLEDGRASAHAQSTTVQQLLERVLPSLRQRASSAGMLLNIVNHADEQAISVDVEMIGQILFNLVDNACKYARGSGEPVIDLIAAMQRNQLVLRVCDHGPGVPVQFARVIFAPFERGSHNPGDTVPGVGLGLALCRGLARDMGGELILEAQQPGCGACFTLTVPT